jgi:hypothetical protein
MVVTASAATAEATTESPLSLKDPSIEAADGEEIRYLVGVSI